MKYGTATRDDQIDISPEHLYENSVKINLQQRVSDIQQGINCAEHKLIED